MAEAILSRISSGGFKSFYLTYDSYTSISNLVVPEFVGVKAFFIARPSDYTFVSYGNYTAMSAYYFDATAFGEKLQYLSNYGRTCNGASWYSNVTKFDSATGAITTKSGTNPFNISNNWDNTSYAITTYFKDKYICYILA